MADASELRRGDRFIFEGERETRARTVVNTRGSLGYAPWPEHVIDVDYDDPAEHRTVYGRFNPGDPVIILPRISGGSR